MSASWMRCCSLVLFSGALVVSLLYPPTAALWHALDSALFFWLSSFVQHHLLQQLFWATANIKSTDIFGASFLLGFFLIHVFSSEGTERKRRWAGLVYALLWFELSMLLCKQTLTPLLMSQGWGRHSPTVVYDTAFRLSSVLPGSFKIKDSSYFSFPADHASVVLLWCWFLGFFLSWKHGLGALCFSALFLLPRLISGAHWFSDIAVGSLAWVSCIVACALYSPVYTWLYIPLERRFTRNTST